MSLEPEIVSLRDRLASERNKMLAALEMFSPAELTHADDGGWSVKDIVMHVANAEKLNVKFVRLMVETSKPVQLEALAADYPDYIGAFDLDRFNAFTFEKLRDVPLGAALGSLTEVRAATLAWVETLTPEQLDMIGVHAAWGEQSVKGMLKILALHDKMHTQEILKRRAAGASN